MSPNRLQSGRAAVLGLMAAVGLAGCARVTPEQLQTELTAVRSEMTTADNALSGRIDATDGKVTALTSRLDSLERDLQALRTEFNASIQRMETAVRFNVPVHFDFDDATVRESDRAMLDRFAQVVGKYYTGSTITVEGFTDPAGSASYNQHLGQERAEAVSSYLSGTAGLSAATLKAVSYGEARNRQVVPDAQGPGDAGIENRRVALVVDFAGNSTPPSTTAAAN